MFRFRLDKVLRYRSRLVDREAQRLKEAADALQAVIRRREDLQRSIAALIREGEEERRRGDVQLWRLRADYLRALQARLTGLRGAERRARAAVEEQRRRLLEAHRRRLVLEKLKEHQHAAWAEQERRRERKRMDEVGGVRAAVPAERTD
jgi:flagellar export protein FliJ